MSAPRTPAPDAFVLSPREAWLSAGLVFLVALAVRAVSAAGVPFPVPEDTAYYVEVARNLVQGRGLVSDALWSYQTPALDPATGTFGLFFPRPAFEVWLPLPSLLMAVPMLLFGPTFHAAQVMSVPVGALVPVLAWRLGADVAAELGLPAGRARTMALGAGLCAAVFGPLVLHNLLPDSTMVFAVLALWACLLMERLVRDASGGRRIASLDRRLLGLGVLLGLAAVTRSEAAWVALTWALLAWLAVPGARRERLRLVAVPAVVALAVFAPWGIRDWRIFGSPLPGQTAANAFSVTGFDIFAYQVLPTLQRYLAQGPAALLRMRVEGFDHNLFSVLLIPAVPVGPLGLLALPWTGRLRSLRPLLIVSLLTFTITTLVFPVATTWGTFLHAAGPVHVLLLVSCLVALDAVIARVGRWRGWTRPVAWLGPALVAGVAAPFLLLTVTGIGSLAADTQARYAALPGRLAAAGIPLSADAPVVTDFPIWLSYADGVPTLALPDESPASVLSLAQRFGARLLVVQSSGHGAWPQVIEGPNAPPGAACFQAVPLPPAGAALAETRAYLIVCR